MPCMFTIPCGRYAMDQVSGTRCLVSGVMKSFSPSPLGERAGVNVVDLNTFCSKPQNFEQGVMNVEVMELTS